MISAWRPGAKECGEGRKSILPSDLQKKCNPVDMLILAQGRQFWSFGLQNCTMRVVLFKATNLEIICSSTDRKLIQ